MMKKYTKTLSILAVTAAAVSTVSAATYVWTGAGVDSNDIDAADNWTGGLVPASGSKLGTGPSTLGGSGDLISFNSTTATAMPTGNIELVRISSNGTQLPNFELLNGTLNFNRAMNMGHAGTTFTIGDGDLTTLAQANFIATIDLNNNNNGTKIYIVKADGTLSFGEAFTWSNGGSRDAVLQLLGGTVTSSNEITGLIGDAGDYVSFDAAGSTFTAGFGGSFVLGTDVTGEFGDSFRLGGALASDGSTLSYTDNGNSTFTVAVVPEPTTTALLGLGGLALILRRRK